MWHWVGHIDAAEPSRIVAAETVPELSERFEAQGEAESWLGEHYPELAESGVGAVSLYEEDRLVYGPMSLRP